MISSTAGARPAWHGVGLAALAFGLLLWVFREGLAEMVEYWQRDAYSHGYMIPAVAAFLIAQRVPLLGDVRASPSWWGLAVLGLAALAWLLGELSTIFMILQYGFLLGLAGLLLLMVGWRGVRLIWGGLLYLLFMIPLPQFLYNNLSAKLQLLSSELGVAVVRAMGISVHLEGNVIDLGTYQLQVVEACSGLNYLFPLMSFGFLIAYLFQGKRWQRILIFLSAAPITVLMNSFRIGVIGVLVDRHGIGMAEGFLHYFEGWVIFLACAGLLLLEVYVIDRLGERRGTLARLDLSFPLMEKLIPAGNTAFSASRTLLTAGVALLGVVAVGANAIGNRTEHTVARERFTAFPMLLGEWVGRPGRLDQRVLDSLELSDYLVADYRRPTTGDEVNLYIAWYDSQRKGSAIHSPRTCIPGDGWEIQELTQVSIPSVLTPDGPLRVNRAIIQKGSVRNLVYYWFQQRGRIITNEYAAKWYIFLDSVLMNRTDGALVRVVVNVPRGDSATQEDVVLQQFLATAQALLGAFIPQRHI
ncbi:MAG: hypothetical protein CALGDGBN_02328 [Pseudomonadales bacterium]|nr:hypothetical protein [Pseudomonadales bacterium]